jgi:hypothetical protein
MTRSMGLLAAAALLALAPAGTAGEMKAELKVDGTNPQALRTRFSTYGYHPRQSAFVEGDAVRIRLPEGVKGVGQTGVYSFFSLAGDCEVTLSYELINVPAPKGGYGTGVGLALDAGETVGRGSIQRVVREKEGNGYALDSVLMGSGGKAQQDEDRFVAVKAKKGRLGLRRVKKELIFLAADTPTGELQEIERLPFTDRTIQAVRFYADPGGSPTAVDVRIRQIEVHAEEIAGGVPLRDQGGWSVWWLLLGPVAAGVGVLLLWLWRDRRLRAAAEDEKPAPPRRRAPVKKPKVS